MAKRTKKKAMEPAPVTAAPRWQLLAQALIIVAAGVWVYWPALHGGWLWDDDLYVTNNELLRTLGGLQRIWFDPTASHDYYPLDNTVWWVEWQLWGMDSMGYHVTNLVCHLLSSLLVWRLLAKFRLCFAWLGGLLFAVHPLQVESVAWVAELKNTLSLPFFLLAILCWIEFEDHRRRRDYLLALVLYTVAMLGKPTMLAFPAAILLYAWWQRGRIVGCDVAACLPFAIVSVIFGVVTVAVTQHLQPLMGTVRIEAPDNPLTRILASGLILPFVFWYVFIPVGLIPVYAPIQVDFAEPAQYLPWPVLAGVLYYLWTKRKTWGRHALLLVGFFLIMLAPVLIFVATDYRTMTWSMDHLDYLPMIGIAAIFTAALGGLAGRIPAAFRLPGAVLIGVVMAALAWESHVYATLYADQEQLLTYTLKENPLAWPANYNLGLVMMKLNRTSLAIAQFRQALKLAPYYPKAHDSLGNALSDEGHADEALDEYRQALDLDPNYAEAHFNYGRLLQQTGHLDEAAEQYETALKLNPDLYQARYNWANLLQREGRVPEAIDQYQTVLIAAPDYIEARENFATSLLKSGHADEAIAELEEGLKYRPEDAGLHYVLGNAYYVSSHAAKAMDEFRQALKIDPGMAEAHYNLGYALMQSGQTAEAIEQFQETLKIHPDDTGARENLEKLRGK